MQESHELQKEAFPSKGEITDLLRDCKELLKEKSLISDKIKDYKISLRKANRDQQYAHQQKERAAKQTSALAQNSSMDVGKSLLGKRSIREITDVSHLDENEAHKRHKQDTNGNNHQEDLKRGHSSHQKLSSVVGSSAIKREEEPEGVITLKSTEDIPMDERRAQRAQKWQSNESGDKEEISRVNSDLDKHKQDKNQSSQYYSKQAESEQRAIKREQPKEEVKRTRNLFSNMMKHLEKAKSRLESEKEILEKQGQVQQKVTEMLQKDSSIIQEVQLTEIEDKLNQEINNKREIERKLIILNEQVRNQKHIEHLGKLENFIQTETKPQIFWLPAKHNEKTQKALQQTQELYQQKVQQFKEDCKAKLEERLRIYDTRIDELNLRRKLQPSESFHEKELEKVEVKVEVKIEKADSVENAEENEKIESEKGKPNGNVGELDDLEDDYDYLINDIMN